MLALDRSQRVTLGWVAAAIVTVAVGWMLAGAVAPALTAWVVEFDRVLLLAFRGAEPDTPAGPLALQEAVRDITALGGFTITTGILAVATLYLVMLGRRRQAVFLLATVLSGILLTLLLKEGFDRPRPDLVPHGSHAMTSSFPSGHSATAAVIYLTLAALITQALRQGSARVLVMVTAIVTTIAVGLSRVYLGVHWPSDVLAGWLLGTGWALGGWLLEQRLQRRGTLEPEPDTQAAARPVDS